MTGLTYDTGALVTADRNERRMWALHKRTLERGAVPTVPAPVLVEGWRGGVSMTRLLQGCYVDQLDEAVARKAGLMLGSCPVSVEATDAVVVEGALRRQEAVVTSNRGHLEALANGVSRRVSIIDT